MTKKYMKELQSKYGMEIMRHYITHEAQGLILTTPDLVPELDALIEKSDQYHVCVRELLDDFYVYKIWLPTDWFDLWGWA